jgi:hypothetical protein
MKFKKFLNEKEDIVKSSLKIDNPNPEIEYEDKDINNMIKQLEKAISQAENGKFPTEESKEATILDLQSKLKSWEDYKEEKNKPEEEEIEDQGDEDNQGGQDNQDDTSDEEKAKEQDEKDEKREEDIEKRKEEREKDIEKKKEQRDKEREKKKEERDKEREKNENIKFGFTIKTDKLNEIWNKK